MTAEPRAEFGGYVGATLEYVREHGPLTTNRRTTVTGQIARDVGVSVERAWQILTLLGRAGVVRLELAGQKRIVRAEAAQ